VSRRIRDIANTVIEVGAELAWDLIYQHIARRTGVTRLVQRVDALERHISQAELRPRGFPRRPTTIRSAT